MRVGWYVHHHGRGHLARARVVGAELVSRGHELTLLGSAVTPGQWSVTGLPMDDEGVDVDRDDVTAGGRLHWVPLRHTGLRARGALIARWVEDWRPDVLVVDVSVEVTLLARLLGVPVVVVAQPGVRDDPAHALAYDSAAGVLAPWPRGWASSLAPHLGRTATTACEVGGISRLSPTGEGRPGTGVVLAGGEGFEDSTLVDRITGAVPELEWSVLDGRAWVDDLGGALSSAEVVVAHAGQNALADVAAADRPVLLLPQERPFDEQLHLARAVADQGLARMLGRCAQADRSTDWAAEVTAARQGSGLHDAWETAGAAARAAEMIEAVGRG